MRSIEVTIQYLLKNGFDPYTGRDPYQGLVYTSVQERATAISHTNTGKLADGCGDEALAEMCTRIAGDEARHEHAYKLFFRKVVELDPSGALTAFEAMMRKKVVMPAQGMEDGEHDLFLQHVSIAQRTKVYTTRDYAGVIEHLIDFWGIPALTQLSAEGARAQEYLCGLRGHYRARADRIESRLARQSKTPCPWLFGRPV
jgi:acyl-[acyl-carrier-protein] desaturase